MVPYLVHEVESHRTVHSAITICSVSDHVMIWMPLCSPFTDSRKYGCYRWGLSFYINSPGDVLQNLLTLHSSTRNINEHPTEPIVVLQYERPFKATIVNSVNLPLHNIVPLETNSKVDSVLEVISRRPS